MPQVSVIVLTYNPDNAKLRRTLAAAARQQEVDMELIISDDGSARKDFSFLPEYMDSLRVKSYRLLEHTPNRGTVQSCLKAVEAATGEYVFLTSPGDYLFDPLALRDAYRFATENKASVCFGNAVFYNETGLTRQVGVPASPKLYAPDATVDQIKTCFFGGMWVIGAAYFRRRETALRQLRNICDTSVYMEDTPTTMFALAEGERLCHMDRNLVWYEDGTGVSTGASDKWTGLLNKDLLTSLEKLKNQYPRDPWVDFAYINAAETNRKKRLIKKLLKHPLLSVRLILYKKTTPTPVRCTEEDMAYLSEVLQWK